MYYTVKDKGSLKCKLQVKRKHIHCTYGGFFGNIDGLPKWNE